MVGRIIRAYLRASMRALFSFRGDFLVAGISMAITNLTLFLPLYFLSAANGGFGVFSHELVTMGVAISLISYTIGVNFTSGIIDLQEIIINGDLDKLLLRPIGIYKHLQIYRINSWMLGELIGALVLLTLNPLHTWPLIILLGVIGGILFNHIAVLFNLTPLFLRQDREQSFWETLIVFSIYPPSVYNDVGRFIALYILPGAMTAYGGLYVLLHPAFAWVYVSFIVGVIALTHTLLAIGIKRYTSAGY